VVRALNRMWFQLHHR